MVFLAFGVSLDGGEPCRAGRSAAPRTSTPFVNSTTLDRVVALVWRDSGRVLVRTSV